MASARPSSSRWSRLHGTRFTLIGRRSPDQVWNTELSAVRDSVCYLQADATDPAALAAAIAAAEKQQGPITAAIHAALIMADRSIRNMDDETFCSAWKSSVWVYIIFIGICGIGPCVGLPSSPRSMLSLPMQGNRIMSLVARSRMRSAINWPNQARFPVRIVNWGYWGEVGRVATEAYRRRMQRLGVGSIATEEGLVHPGADTRRVRAASAGGPRRTSNTGATGL